MCHHHAEFCFRRAPGHDTIPPDSLPPVNKDAPVFQGLPHFHLRSHPSGLFHSHLCQHSKRSLSSHLKYSQAFPALLSQALASITPHTPFSASEAFSGRILSLLPAFTHHPVQSFFRVFISICLLCQPHSLLQCPSLLCFELLQQSLWIG